MDAETRFRRIRGYRDLSTLITALTNAITPEVDNQAISAYSSRILVTAFPRWMGHPLVFLADG